MLHNAIQWNFTYYLWLIFSIHFDNDFVSLVWRNSQRCEVSQRNPSIFCRWFVWWKTGEPPEGSNLNREQEELPEDAPDRRMPQHLPGKRHLPQGRRGLQLWVLKLNPLKKRIIGRFNFPSVILFLRLMQISGQKCKPDYRLLFNRLIL